jgi:hypothetical protein
VAKAIMSEPAPAGDQPQLDGPGARASERSIVVVSSGVRFAVVVAAPLGLLIVAAGIAGPLVQLSLASVFVSVIALGFGAPMVVSSAYSAWGTCSLSAGDDGFAVIHALWRWRWTWRFPRSRIRSVFVYRPPAGYVLWPGSYGLHVRVLLSDSERSVPIASGMHAPRETLDEIRAMLAPPT